MVKLEEITVIDAPIARCFDLARSVDVHLAGNTHFGETAIAAGGVTSGLLSIGQRVTWQARHFWVRQKLTSEITAMHAPVYFQDKMIGGAFQSMDHDHFFRALSKKRTEMKDVFRFTAPIPLLGPIAEALILRKYMRTLLHERNMVIKEIAESGRGGITCLRRKAMRVVITGGSGQVGYILARHFQEQGHHVTVISRHPRPQEWRTTPWDGITLGDWVSDLEGSDALINLAGRSVNCRYNESNRRSITESRVGTTRLLHRAVTSLDRPPRVWLNASTATIYRHALDRPMDEATGELGGNEPGVPSTWNFSIRVAKAWEEAFFATPTPATRKIAMRSALTLSPDCGGIFDVLLGLVRHFVGGTMGSGAQYVSWIHEADFVRAVEFLIDREDIDGVVNLSSPHPLPNRQFLRALRQAWCVCPGLPLPEWALAIGAVLLRTETELVLKSRRVVPGRLLASGFSFKFPDWPAAARELVERWRIQRRC